MGCYQKDVGYLLETKFIVYTDNNPQVYIKTSKLGVSQMRWLRHLSLFNFNMQYHPGKSYKATDALSRFTVNLDVE